MPRPPLLARLEHEIAFELSLQRTSRRLHSGFGRLGVGGCKVAARITGGVSITLSVLPILPDSAPLS
jgi:hypothetical protein